MKPWTYSTGGDLQTGKVRLSDVYMSNMSIKVAIDTGKNGDGKKA